LTRFWSRLSPWGGVLCALVFFLLGCIFAGYPGLEVDEAMFAAPQYRDWCFFSIPLRHHRIPVMHLSYCGALKTWLFAPILSVLPPTRMVLRLPAVLMGSATILLFWALLYRLHGRRAAWTGCILLATDTIFLLTTTFDWGPVALQHLLAVAAMLLAARWYRGGGAWPLAAAAFCCGLAFWDKAVFIWIFTGFCCGLLLFASGIWRRMKWRDIALAVGALCLGALPLIVYNLAAEPKFATIRSNSQFTPQPFAPRLNLLRHTWNGSAMLGFIANEDSASQPKSPSTLLERTSFAVRSVAGEHRTNLMTSALLLAVALLPLLWRTRARQPMLFCLIAIPVGWTVMALSNGGFFTHHTVLLWPLPHLLLAVAFAEASHRRTFGRWALAALVGFLAAANLLVTNQYLYQLIRNGAHERWTDAIYALADGLRGSEASQVVFPDWGMLESICVLNRDKPPTRLAAEPFGKSELEILPDTKAIWVEHTPGNEISEGVNGRVLTAAQLAGFDPVMLATYADSNGRPIFQALRFIRRAGSETPRSP
jgi:4-amino-4-deoxy-L-arabinose transferase-like glycosyltransferase